MQRTSPLAFGIGESLGILFKSINLNCVFYIQLTSPKQMLSLLLFNESLYPFFGFHFADCRIFLHEGSQQLIKFRLESFGLEELNFFQRCPLIVASENKIQ